MTESRSDIVVCYGDSQTAGFSWGNRIPRLSDSITQAIGRGVSGQEAGSVAIRQGGMVLSTTADCTIPASTDPVIVPVAADITPCNIRSSSSATPVVLAGVRGTLTILGKDADAGIDAWNNAKGVGTGSFVPDTVPSEAVTVPSGTDFVSQDVVDHPEWAGYMQVIWIGGNDSAFAGSTRVSGVVSAAQSMVDRMKTAVDTPRFLVASRTVYASETEGKSSWNTAVEQREALKAEFPEQAIDIWGHVRDNGLDILGITPTEADQAALDGKSMPPSLTADNIHYSSATREGVLAPFIVSELAARGWATETSGEVVPVAEYSPTTWKNGKSGGTPLSADNFNNIETGVQAALEASSAATQGVADVRDKKRDLVTDPNRVYTSNGSGEPSSIEYSATKQSASTIAVRSSGGALMVGSPSNNGHAATKKYVDDAVAEFVPKADYDALAARVAALEAPPSEG